MQVSTNGVPDVWTAFLTAPLMLQPTPSGQKRVVILRPPAILTRNNLVDPQEVWFVDGAVYGLVEYSRAWQLSRDKQLCLGSAWPRYLAFGSVQE